MATIAGKRKSPYYHTNVISIVSTDAVPTTASSGGVCKIDAKAVLRPMPMKKEKQRKTGCGRGDAAADNDGSTSTSLEQKVPVHSATHHSPVTRLNSRRHADSADMALISTYVSKEQNLNVSQCCSNMLPNTVWIYPHTYSSTAQN